MTEAPPKQPITGTESVTMGAATGLPQYEDPNIAPPITPGYGSAMPQQPGGGLVAVRQQINADSFAIFQALQDRMEMERQRSQRRTSAMVFTFSILLVIIVGGIFAFLFMMMRNMQGTQNNLLQAALAGVNARNEAVSQPVPAPVVVTTPAPAPAQPDPALIRKMEQMSQMLEKVQKDNETLRTSVQEANKAVAEATAAAEEAKKNKKPVSYVKPVTPRATEATVAIQPEQPVPPMQSASSAAVSASAQAYLVTQPQSKSVEANPITEKAEEKADTKSSDATQVAAENLQRVSVGKIAPGLKVNRVDPPKGYKTDAIQLSNHSGETVSWRVQLPLDAK